MEKGSKKSTSDVLVQVEAASQEIRSSSQVLLFDSWTLGLLDSLEGKRKEGKF